MNTIQRYELIRPILKGEKKPKQVSEEKGVPQATPRWRRGHGKSGGKGTQLWIESLG